MQDIFAIIGAVSGIASLLAIIYLVGVWKSRVDTNLGNIIQSMQKYPLEQTALMAKTLWEIYVVDALQHRPDLAERGSGFRLKQEGKDIIPDYMLTLLKRVPRNPLNSEQVATGYLVVKHIGLDIINKMAEEKELTVQESIAILSTWLESQA